MATVATLAISVGIMSHNSQCFTALGLEFASISAIAITIAKKAGLENRINAIKEKLELLDLQNNNNEEEKGRSL